MELNAESNTQLTINDFFLNHSYLSEKWLYETMLLFKKRNSSLWTTTLETHLKDELRHTEMCRSILLLNNKLITDDTKYSLQTALYYNIGNLDLGKIGSSKNLQIVTFFIERRAALLYKMYLRYGSNLQYKKIIKLILLDETRHKNLHKIFPIAQVEDLFYHKIFSTDQYIFGEYLTKKYSDEFTGRQVFVNRRYWLDLFSGSL